MLAYWDTVESIEKLLKTDKNKGLTHKEAKKRLASADYNRLQEKSKKRLIFLFFEQFNDFLILILIAAACISFFTSIMDKDGDILEPVIIMAIVVLNGILGMIQEHKAEKSLEALKKMSAPVASVIRNGERTEIPSEEICKGDAQTVAYHFDGE